MLIRCIREGCWDLVCFYPFFSWYPSNSCVFFCFLKPSLLLLFPDLVILHIFVSSSETQWEVAFVFDVRFSLEILLQLLKGKKNVSSSKKLNVPQQFWPHSPKIVPVGLCAGNCKVGVTMQLAQWQEHRDVWGCGCTVPCLMHWRVMKKIINRTI